METQELDKQIQLLRTKINLETNSTRKQVLNKGLQSLLYKKEIEEIKKRIEQLG